MFASLRHLRASALSPKQADALSRLFCGARADILRMTTGAGSGHPGGSISSAGLYLLLLAVLDDGGHDRLVASHGHTAAGLYAALGRMGYFDPAEAIAGFRREGSIFEGHPSPAVPGVAWCSGALGQGLSVGCGFAAAAQRLEKGGRAYVVMGDGEQAKGQLAEAREFAARHGLANLTAVVDNNRLQASGALKDVLPQNIAAKYTAAGWQVEEADGHDFAALYLALRRLAGQGRPGLLLAHTVMGKGVPGREDDFTFHGSPLKQERAGQLLAEQPEDSFRVDAVPRQSAGPAGAVADAGVRIVYGVDAEVDLRSAFGRALHDIAHLNDGGNMAVFDCDLLDSVKLAPLAKVFPHSLYECGIAEQNALTTAAAMAKEGVATFAAGFGVFIITEVYSQLRMADINKAPLKLAATHCGLDVGEDGKTHQCLDYLSLLGNMAHIKTLVPADANQADAMVRHMAVEEGAFCLCMGRSALPVLAGENGQALFGPGYTFRYGEGHWLHKGTDATVIALGGMAARAMGARQILLEKGVDTGVYLVACPDALDAEDMAAAAATGCVLVCEDHLAQSGLGTRVAAHLMENGLRCRYTVLGVKGYASSAPSQALYRLCGLTPDNMAKKILTMRSLK